MKRRDFLKVFLGVATVLAAGSTTAPEAQASWVSTGARRVGRGVNRAGRSLNRGVTRVGRSIGRGARRVRRQVFGRRAR